MTLAWRSDGADDAPPLVLLNAVGSTTEMWTPCLPSLTPHLRVLRFDHRGHGRSAPRREPVTIEDLAADVLATADSLGLTRFDLAGLSLGGMVGIRLAAAHPDRIRRLALLCTSAHPTPASVWRERAVAVRAGGMSAIADPAAARWITQDRAAADPDLFAGLRAMIADDIDAATYAHLADMITGLDLRPDLPRITAPTLVVGARSDIALPMDHQRAIAEAVPGARLELIDGGHLPTFEHPARVARLLLDHFPAPGLEVVAGDR